MNKGQAFTAMKLVQGAIIALVLLGIVYGALNLVKQYEPGSDVLTISADLLSSAYEAAGTGQSFTRKAKLKQQVITSAAIKSKAGLTDPDLNVYIQCKLPVGTVITGSGERPCDEVCKGNTCKSLILKSGAQIDVCAYCRDVSACYIVLGSNSC